MTGREIYEIWAPKQSKWSKWVRPVPFIAIDNGLKVQGMYDLNISDSNYKIENLEETVIIVDLPGIESIKEGLALINLGFRPIPIYNGTEEQENSRATTDNSTIKLGLISGATKIKKLDILDSAMPAFLLDSNRLNRYKMNSSIFDNSWDIFGQDLPSAKFLIENNVKKVIVISNVINKDLKKILYQFQKLGIQIFLNSRYGESKKVVLKSSVNKYKN